MGISQVYYNSYLLNDADTCEELEIEADSELLLLSVDYQIEKECKLKKNGKKKKGKKAKKGKGNYRRPTSAEE